MTAKRLVDHLRCCAHSIVLSENRFEWFDPKEAAWVGDDNTLLSTGFKDDQKALK